MATFNNFFRAYTDDLSLLISYNGTTTAATQLYSKTVRVSVDPQAAPATTDVLTSILNGIEFGDVIPVGGFDKAYLYLELKSRSSALAATDAVTAIVTNNSTAGANAAAYHTLLNVGDNVVIPWQTLQGDNDVNEVCSLDLAMNYTAGAGKYCDVYVAVYYTR
jgi:hypothetical protein